jgi:hypothetical protein
VWKLEMPKEQNLDETIRAVAQVMLPVARRKIKLPNVIGIGSARCGTSYLFGLLAGHANFYVSPLKEVNYFGIKQTPFTPGGWSLDDYRLCFASQKAEKYIAEISPVYISHSFCIQQIAIALRPVRLLITIREPLARFVSHFKYHMDRHGFDDINRYAEAALHEYIPGYFDLRWNRPVKALQLSLYSAGVKAAFEAVGPQNVLILLYEDLAEDDAAWKKQLGEFFATDFSTVNVRETLKNASSRGETFQLNEQNRSGLMRLFAEDTARLSNLIGQDLTRRWGGRD